MSIEIRKARSYVHTIAVDIVPADWQNYIAH